MKNISVLIMDDSQAAAEHTHQTMNELEFQNIELSYNSTIEIEKEYDLAIIDVVMPKKNGVELSKELKTKYPKIKIILVSTLDEERIQMQLIDALADEFVPKPVQKEVLSKVIHRLFE